MPFLNSSLDIMAKTLFPWMSLQLRGVRPFLSDKYDLTQHPNFKLTADYDKKNEFKIEEFLSHRLRMKADDEFVVVDAD